MPGSDAATLTEREDFMASASAETVTPTPCTIAWSTVGRAAHLAHARLLRRHAADAVEDGVHTATRAVTRGARMVRRSAR